MLDDYVKHFNYVLPAFNDKRYIRVNGKPLFYVYAPQLIPNSKEFIDIWQQLAKEHGLSGIHFVAMVSSVLKNPDVCEKLRQAGSRQEVMAILNS